MDGQQQRVPFEISLTSGRGLLDARALWASLVGPQRLAMTLGKVVELRADRSAEIVKNLGASEVYVFAGVSLPSDGNAPAAGVQTLFSSDPEMGVNTAIPVTLAQVMVGGTFFPLGFTQLLQPGEQLYAKLNDTALGPNGTQRVLVKTVIF